MVMDVLSCLDEHYFEKSFYTNSSILVMWVLGLSFPLFTLFCDVWLKLGGFFLVRKLLMTTVYNLLEKSGKCLYVSGFPIEMTGVFLVLLSSNLSGLIPFSLKMSSYVPLSFFIGLMLWGPAVFSGIHYVGVRRFMANQLLPQGVPNILSPMVILGELASNLSRPFVISLRLVVNVTFGVVLMDFLGDNLSFLLCYYGPYSMLILEEFRSQFYQFLTLSLSMVFMSWYELWASVVQVFVFCFLMCNYMSQYMVKA